MPEIYATFKDLHPNGSITTELLQIFQKQYIVRASITIEATIRATGMAASESLETAEDKARERALMIMGINTPKTVPHPIKTIPQETKYPVDLSDIIAATDIEMTRLHWSKEQGQAYLVRTYGKTARAMLTEQELREFLVHLRSQA